MNEKLLITICKSHSLVAESAGATSPLGAVPEGCMRMQGVFGLTGVKNNNQRYYVTENYTQMVNGLNSRISEGVFGQLEHPNNMDMNWDLVSHKVESISIDESTGVVSGSVLLLPTDKGKIVQTLVKNGLQLKISSRAKGIVAEDGKVTLSHLETYDLVYRPGFSQARLSAINESLDESGKLILETLELEMNETSTVTGTSNNFDIKTITAQVLEAVLKSLPEETLTNEAVDAKVEEAVLKMQNHVKESMHKFASATQNWAINEFAPSIQGWIEHVYEAEQRQFLTETFAGAIQNWAINEFAPQIQGWAVNEFAPQIQGWTINEFAPQVQGWTINEFAPQVQGWLSSEFAPNATNVTENAPFKELTKDAKIGDSVRVLMGNPSAKANYKVATVVSDKPDANNMLKIKLLNGKETVWPANNFYVNEAEESKPVVKETEEDDKSNATNVTENAPFKELTKDAKIGDSVRVLMGNPSAKANYKVATVVSDKPDANNMLKIKLLNGKETVWPANNFYVNEAEESKPVVKETEEDDKSKVKPTVNDKVEETGDTKVDESANPEKSLTERIDEQLAKATALKEEETATIVAENAINEDKAIFEAQLIASIPASVQHLWEASSDEFKETTLAQASIRNFTNESQQTRFWMTRFIKSVADTIVESKKPTSTLIQINENVSHVTPKIANGLVAFCKSLQ